MQLCCVEREVDEADVALGLANNKLAAMRRHADESYDYARLIIRSLEQILAQEQAAANQSTDQLQVRGWWGQMALFGVRLPQ